MERFGVQPLQPPPAKPVRLVGSASPDPAQGHAHEHVHADGTRHVHAHEHEGPHGHGQGHDHDHDHVHPGDHVHDHPHGPGVEAAPTHVHTHTHADGTTHTHSHDHPGHEHAADGAGHHHLAVHAPILAHNDRLAERNRGYLQARGLLALNVLASPGAGKTLLIEKTVAALEPDFPAAVIVGDLATANDARRIRDAGAPVVQITTGTVCHLDAEMVARGLEQLDLAGRRLLIIENVGNLVCPADFDLGETVRVALVAVTEGEDKPLKYPPLFRSSHVVIVTKLDLATAAGCDLVLLRNNIRAVAPQARVFELSSRSGEGFDAWLDWLRALDRH